MRLQSVLYIILLSVLSLSSFIAVPGAAYAASDTDKINTAGWSDSPYVTPDGKSLYFMYARYNFFPTFTGKGPPTLLGPTRAHHQANDVNPYWDSDIYVSHRGPDGRWGSPANLTGVNTPKDNCCAMVIGGRAEKIIYQAETPNRGRDLVYRHRNSDGSYGPLMFFPDAINSSANEDNPHMSADGRRLYFSSDRPGGYGHMDIWFSYLNDQEQWAPAVNIGATINTSDMEDQFWIADRPNTQGDYAVFFNRTPSAIFQSSWSPYAGFRPPTKLDLGHKFVGEASMTADGRELYFGSGDLATGRMRIMVSLRLSDGRWSKGKPVD